jgi:hypothetical protein
MRQAVQQPSVHKLGRKFPSRRSPAGIVGGITTAAANGIRSEKARPARGGGGSSRSEPLVLESTRRVVVKLSSNWPYLALYRQISQRILGRAAGGTS